MEHKIEANPDYSILSVKVPAGEKLMVEASSMASMSSNMQMKTKLAGGLLKSLFLLTSLQLVNLEKPKSALLLALMVIFNTMF